MSQTDQKQTWRSRLGWLAGQLFVIFLGVSAAFVLENYRETLSQREELHQAVAGIITELEHYETRSVQYADAFNAAAIRAPACALILTFFPQRGRNRVMGSPTLSQ